MKKVMIVLSVVLLTQTVTANTGITDNNLPAPVKYAKVPGYFGTDGKYFEYNRKKLFQDIYSVNSFYKRETGKVEYFYTDYLPLTGGTLTGTLSGTDASFSGSLSALNGKVSFVDAGTGYTQMADENAFARIWFETVGSKRTILDVPSGGHFVFRDHDGTIISSISETGAPTFAGALTGTSASFSSSLSALNGKVSFVDAGTGYTQMTDENAFARIWFETVGSKRTILDVPSGGYFAFRDHDGNIGAKILETGGASFQNNIGVNGAVTAKKMTVTQSGWSDYVFNDEYKLKSLSEVAQYIKYNKHLPDVPSAKEVEEKGIDVGDTQALLLKKIEELTLYMIEINQRIKKVEAENKSLRKKINGKDR